MLIKRIADEFMMNSSFGFDFFLSKRVRHQSFIGLIRGPLEFSGLITNRASEASEYNRNDLWLERFSQLNSTQLDLLSDSFVQFAKEFDETLMVVKDKILHVRSAEYPNGLLYLELTSPVFTLTRAIVRLDAKVHDFIVTVVQVLWGALEPSLALVRRFIAEELKTRIADIFDKFRARARKIPEDDPAFLQLDVEVGKRSNEVQRALDDVILWFTRSDVAQAKRLFELPQAVDIAIDAALKCQRGFEPAMNRTVDGDLCLVASSLVFLHDVLFIAFDNARAHSGLKKPTLNIEVSSNQAEGTLTVSVTSEVRQSVRAASEPKLRELRALIEKGSVERRTRKEGGSGFLKLAAVVRQSDKGRIEFGYTEDGRFILSVVYSLIIHSVLRAEVEDA